MQTYMAQTTRPFPSFLNWKNSEGVLEQLHFQYFAFDLVWLWLWLWRRPAAVAPVGSLAKELPYATGEALKKRKKGKGTQ